MASVKNKIVFSLKNYLLIIEIICVNFVVIQLINVLFKNQPIFQLLDYFFYWFGVIVLFNVPFLIIFVLQKIVILESNIIYYILKFLSSYFQDHDATSKIILALAIIFSTTFIRLIKLRIFSSVDN